VNALSSALPHGIREAQFCQGGVREGVLFQELPASVRKEDPLEVATSPYARPSAKGMADILLASIPPTSKNDARSFPWSLISVNVVRSLANVLFQYSDLAKESSSAAALYSTTTGILASSHGVSHADCALLALMFEERFEGELLPREAKYKVSLQALLTAEQVWWSRYLGKLAMMVVRMCLAGTIEETKARVKVGASWKDGMGRQGDKGGIEIKFGIQKRIDDTLMLRDMMEELLGVIEKVGKEGWE
jgi:retrograde regulation protein 2